MIAFLRKEAPSLFLVGGLLCFAAWRWPQSPDRMPVHWGIDGQPDRWGGRFEGLLLLPGLSLGLYLLFLLLPRLDPRGDSYARFGPAFWWIRTSILYFLGIVYLATQASQLGIDLPLDRVLSIASGLLMVLMGNFMGKLRPNWFVGIRTPWTLSSTLSWNRTHRLGGWAFIGLGAVILLAGLYSPAWAVGALVVGALGVSVGLAIYSYQVWKGDPERRSEA
jgi:uncharacterized membrane protein